MAAEEELVGIFEIAGLARVTRAAVTNWRARFTDFPPPVAELKSGPVFRRWQVERWLQKRRGRMATVISTINLKGGVAKSTTTVGIAEILAGEFRKRVLVIDLDPQTNGTVMLIGEDAWKERNDRGHTLAQLFKDAIEEDSTKHKFDLSATLVRGVSNVEAVDTLDLLPSSLDLIDVQDRLATMPAGRFLSNTPTDILRRSIRGILENYDYVIIDCPPNLGLITLNGLRISSAYLIPTIPDVLSTYGIPQIVSRVKAFSDDIGEDIEPLGIAVSKFRAQSVVHQRMVKRLKDGKLPVFETFIPEANDIAASAEFTPVSTLRQKYGYQGGFNSFLSLAKEILAIVEEVPA
jgi:chromosome partitioning protein